MTKHHLMFHQRFEKQIVKQVVQPAIEQVIAEEKPETKQQLYAQFVAKYRLRLSEATFWKWLKMLNFRMSNAPMYYLGGKGDTPDDQ